MFQIVMLQDTGTPTMDHFTSCSRFSQIFSEAQLLSFGLSVGPGNPVQQHLLAVTQTEDCCQFFRPHRPRFARLRACSAIRYDEQFYR